MSDELDTSGAVAAYLQTRPPQDQVRASLTLAAQADPDAEAEFQRLSRQAGIPVDSVRENKQAVQQQVTAPDYEELATKFPSTTKYLSDLSKARIAHDDVNNLTQIEESFRKSQVAGRAVRGKVDESFSRPGDRRTSGGRVGEAFFRNGDMEGEERSFVGGVTEPVRRGVAQGQRGMTLLNLFPGLSTRRDEAREASGLPAAGSLDLAVQLADQQRRVERFPSPQSIQEGMSAISESATMGEAFQQALLNPRAILEVGMQSFGASAPALVAAAAGSIGGPVGTAAGAGMGSFAVEYASTIQDVLAESGVNGKDPEAIRRALENPKLMAAAREKAVKRGIPIALFDALTAGLAGRLLGGAKKTVVSAGGRAVGELLVQAGGGAAGEALAQAATDEYKPGDILLEALAEMPSALVEVPSNFRHAREKAQRAEEQAQSTEKLAATTQASKLRERDPESFRQFLKEVAEDGETPSDFFIDPQQLANTLNQSAITMAELRAVAPSVAAQFENPVPGADIRIPFDEFAASPEIAQALIDHVRVGSAEEMSRKEAQEFLKTEGDRLQKQVQSVVENTVDKADLQLAIDRVRQHFEEQLNAAGKFRPEVNKAYATVLGNFYAVQAQRADMSVEDFMQRYRLKVVSKEGALGSQQRLEQFAGPSALTADLKALDDAKRRTDKGDDPETIRQETGWFAGRDGKWRFEIDDSRLKVAKLHPDMQAMKEIAGDWITLDRFMREHPNTEIAKGARTLNSMRNAYRMARDQNRISPDTPTLDDIIKADDLFAAYPALKRIRVMLDDSMPIGDGAFAPDHGLMILSPMKTEEMRSVILHEVQHAIQAIEGFQQGVDNRKTSGDDYFRAAGEVEARNTQARRDMSAQERRDTPVWMTEDVSSAQVLNQSAKPDPEQQRAVIDLRKREKVLQSLLDCLGAA